MIDPNLLILRGSEAYAQKLWICVEANVQYAGLNMYSVFCL